MNKKIKKAWVKALRSGKYRQAFKCLYDQRNRGYCCLGVLCSINGKFRAWRDSGSEELNEKALKETKITHGQMSKLVRLNDGDLFNKIAPKNFSQIADYIEENL